MGQENGPAREAFTPGERAVAAQLDALNEKLRELFSGPAPNDRIVFFERIPPWESET